jgi:hypothetical protein
LDGQRAAVAHPPDQALAARRALLAVLADHLAVRPINTAVQYNVEVSSSRSMTPMTT